MIVFFIIPFLFVGALAYLICAAIPTLRRFAMPSSLWILSLLIGFCIWLAIIFAIAIGHDGWNALASQLHFRHLQDFSPFQSRAFSIVSVTALIAGSVAFATAVTFVHQAIIHRVTLALFRLYVAGVSFGVGILSFFPAFLMATARIPNLTAQWAVSSVALLTAIASATSLGWFCFHRASQFRGDYPRNFPIVTRDEFYLVEPSSEVPVRTSALLTD